MQCRQYFANPLVDCLMMCGGLTLVLALLAATPLGITSQGNLLVLGSVLLTTTHFGAPIARSIESKQSIAAKLCRPAEFALLFGAIAGLLIFGQGTLPSVVLVYILFVTIHYSAQNMLICMDYLHKAGLTRTLFFAIAAIAVGALNVLTMLQHLASAGAGEFMSVRLPQITVLDTSLLALLTLLTAGVFFLTFTIACIHARRMPPWPVLMLFTIQITFCFAGTRALELYWLFAPAFMHGTQSIIRNCTNLRGEFNWERAGQSFLFGLAVAYALPQVFRVIGVFEQTAFAAVICVFSLHHFLIEALNKDELSLELR